MSPHCLRTWRCASTGGAYQLLGPAECPAGPRLVDGAGMHRARCVAPRELQLNQGCRRPTLRGPGPWHRVSVRGAPAPVARCPACATRRRRAGSKDRRRIEPEWLTVSLSSDIILRFVLIPRLPQARLPLRARDLVAGRDSALYWAGETDRERVSSLTTDENSANRYLG
jgi:hypothetical protein